MAQKPTQADQVYAALRSLGGVAMLGELYEALDYADWKTRTPQASTRRIVQKDARIVNAGRGLWATLERADLARAAPMEASGGNDLHTQHQANIVKIGEALGRETLKHAAADISLETFVPKQDANRLTIGGERLGDLASLADMPSFGYERFIRHAQTIDVVWFNRRKMPQAFFEVEHTTDFQNSLRKFHELRDFRAHMVIVAAEARRREFEDKIGFDIYHAIKNRVRFLPSESLERKDLAHFKDY